MIVDWVVTIVGAVAIVLLVKAYVVNPYRIPSSSMEPTLHCAQPASGCEARFSDRVLANRFIYHLRDPRRGEIVVFETPDAARVKCGAGGTFVKRIVGLPGETVEVRLQQGEGYVYVNGRKLDEPYVKDGRRAVREFGPTKVAKNGYFMMGDNRAFVLRLARLGLGPARQSHRQGLRDLLAAEPHQPALTREAGFRRSGILPLDPRLRRGRSLKASAVAAATAFGRPSSPSTPSRRRSSAIIRRRPTADPLS